MDQEFAQHLFEIGGFLIVTGLPKGTEIGIDLQSYKSDKQFRGIKMIPPGPHFIYTSSIGNYDNDKTSLRVGFIHYFKRQEIVIREWDSEQEQLRERTCDNRDIELARIREHIRDLDRYLAPFDFSDFDKWRHLTMHITENIIKCSSPDNGIIKSSADFESCPDSERPRGKPRSIKNDDDDDDDPNNSSTITQPTIAERLVLTPLKTDDNKKQLSTTKRITTFDENDYLPRLKIVPGTMPKFIELPKRYDVNATPSEISKSYIDSIDRIDQFMAKFNEKSFTILEEIQFSYIIFLIGYSVEGLAHWRDILHLLANSELAVQKYSAFYRKYLDILKYQLPELPIEFMHDSTINPIYKDIRQMLRNCPGGGLTNECTSLMMNLNDTMAWSFDGVFDEDPDELPIVVDCSGDGDYNNINVGDATITTTDQEISFNNSIVAATQ